MGRDSTTARATWAERALPFFLLGLALFSGAAAAIYLWATRRAFLVDHLEYLALALAPAPILIVASRIWPAKPQPALSKGLWQDIVYFFAMGAFDAVIIAWFAGVLKLLYDHYLSFLTISSLSTWPLGARLVLSLFVSDFLNWFHHFVRHKVPLFWKFHTVHHSQRQMNLFTDLRYHFLEYFIAKFIIFIPAYMLQLEPLNAFFIAIVIRWHTMAYHANLRTNYGPVRYLLVTPQSHRIHHSHALEHRDTNFGVVFCIWDRLFGTQHPDYNSYPDTGIADERFPLEQSVSPWAVIVTLVQQTIYPFRLLFRSREA